MRFSFLVAVEIFFFSLICIGCDGCRGFEDVAIDLKTFFLQNDNIIKREEFKCGKDSHLGLLLNADIDINVELKPEYKLLLCLEEFMYAFRSLFEDKIIEDKIKGESDQQDLSLFEDKIIEDKNKGESDQQDLFGRFCKYVAQEIDKIKIESLLSDLYNKKELGYYILFLNLCKLFFIDDEKEIWEDVRDFRIIFNYFYFRVNCDKGLGEGLSDFTSSIVFKLLERFVRSQKLKNKEEKIKEFAVTKLSVKDFNKNTTSVIESLFHTTSNGKDKGKNSFGEAQCKGIIFIKNSFLPEEIMHRGSNAIGTVLNYDDFVVFKNKESRKEIVWKRERKNRATPYSFYRLLSKEEIREIDIFAKDHEKAVITILEDQIRDQMLYDAKQLCRQVKDFIACDCFSGRQSIWQELLDYCKDKFKENFGEGNELIKNFCNQNGDFEVFFKAYLKKIQDEELTDDLWIFSIKIREYFLGWIEKIFKEESKYFSQIQWFKGLGNIINSCYINALSQNLFDYKKEMGGMVSDEFLEIMSNFQDSGELIQGGKDSLERITGHEGYEGDANDLFVNLFTLGKIKKKKLALLDNNSSNISCEDNVNKKLAADDSFVFKFDFGFLCTESKFGEKELDFKEDFNSHEKKIKTLQYVLKCIYDYLKENYDGLSLILTNIFKCPILPDEFCENNEYSIHISPVSVIDIGSSPVCNGCDLSQFINKLKWEKKDNDENLGYVAYVYYNFSDFLVINLKRYNKSEPLRNNISIPDNICFDADRYDITGIVCHSGRLNSGHYVAYKKKFGLWFKFNDSKVSVVGPSLPDAAVKCAYMLFFKKNKEINDNKKTELKELKKERLGNTRKEKKGNIKEESRRRIQAEGRKKKADAERLEEERIKKEKEAEERRKEEERIKKENEEKIKMEERQRQKEERKKREERERNEKLAKKREIFLSGLLQYYSLFNKRYFGIKNKDGKTFVEYLHDIEKNIKKNDTQYILNLKGKYVLQFCAFLLLKVQEYCNLSNRIKEIGRNSNRIKEIHEEKGKLEELEKLDKDIIMLICKDPTLCNFYREMNTGHFLKEFVKVFFISFCDFDKTCEKPLFGEETLQSLKEGVVEFFFNNKKDINIPADRKLPFFLLAPTAIKNQKNAWVKDNFEEESETIPVPDEHDKYYFIWSHKLIIAEYKKEEGKGDSLINGNEINGGNKINIYSSLNVDADYDSFKNLALFERTSSDVAEYGFFERASDNDCKKYSIQTGAKEEEKKREEQLKNLFSFIGKIEDFIKDFIKKTAGEIKECHEKITNKDQEFFRKKQEEIKAKYDLEIKDRGETIAIAKKYEEELKKELQGLKDENDKIDDEIKKVGKQIDEIKKDINKKQLAAGAQYNNLIKSKSKTQVFVGENKTSIQLEDDKNNLEKLEKKLDVLSRKKKSTENSMYQVDALENLIENLNYKKKELEDVLKNNNNIDFKLYEKRLDSYSQYYKGGENKQEGKNKKNGKNKEKGKNEEALTVLRKLKDDITAVLERRKSYAIQSFAIKGINFADIIYLFDPYPFTLFVSMIEEKISDSIISSYLINDLYEYLFFGKRTCKKVLVGSEQRFKGVQNIGETCYINSILQNLVEFKDDLKAIIDCSEDKGVNSKVKKIHDEVFNVLDTNRIGLHNVLAISIANGIFKTGDPADIYSFLKDYYIDSTYTIEVVNGGKDVKEFSYKYFGRNEHATGDVPSYCGQVVLPSACDLGSDDEDKGIIHYLYNNDDFKEGIRQDIPLSKGPFVFSNIIKKKYCRTCKKKEISIEIQCLPHCLINLFQLQSVGVVSKISDVVDKLFCTGIEDEDKGGIDCDLCNKKVAIVKKRSYYNILNNCLCFNFVVHDRFTENFIEIEDEVKVGDEVYESVCACYYTPGHYIAFKKINDIWFIFNDNNVFPIIYKSLPKMYKGYKPTLVFYKKKIKDKK